MLFTTWHTAGDHQRWSSRYLAEIPNNLLNEETTDQGRVELIFGRAWGRAGGRWNINNEGYILKELVVSDTETTFAVSYAHRPEEICHRMKIEGCIIPSGPW